MKEYVAIMETNSEVLDTLLPTHEIEPDDWASALTYLPTEEQLREVELGVEELEEPV
jgi:hypothetical protein